MTPARPVLQTCRTLGDLDYKPWFGLRKRDREPNDELVAFLVPG